MQGFFYELHQDFQYQRNGEKKSLATTDGEAAPGGILVTGSVAGICRPRFTCE